MHFPANGVRFGLKGHQTEYCKEFHVTCIICRIQYSYIQKQMNLVELYPKIVRFTVLNFGWLSNGYGYFW